MTIDLVRSSFETGDQFLYTGIDRQTEKRIITIVSISVTGMLTFRIDVDDVESDMFHSIPYERALVLVEEMIWIDVNGTIAKRAIQVHDEARPKPELHTPEEWSVRKIVRVLDPDGWRHDGKSWDEPITEAEFDERAGMSTTGPADHPAFVADTPEPPV